MIKCILTAYLYILVRRYIHIYAYLFIFVVQKAIGQNECKSLD